MRIIGTGLDLVELSRIQDALARFGDRFLRRCFTEPEIRFCREAADPIPRLAGRFAAKEAGAKALGTGIARGIAWREIEVRRQPGERPNIFFHGRAKARAGELGVAAAHLSISHAHQVAGAVVILEAED